MTTYKTIAAIGDAQTEIKINTPRKLKKGDPGWIEAYQWELIALRQLGCFIPDDLFPKF
jgi:hypothetical protein